MAFPKISEAQYLLIISLLHFGMPVEILRSSLYPISMKTPFLLTTTTMRKITLLIFLVFAGVFIVVHAQLVSSRTFSNTLSGTVSSSNIVSAAANGTRVTASSETSGKGLQLESMNNQLLIPSLYILDEEKNWKRYLQKFG
jgi:hypothetical protein